MFLKAKRFLPIHNYSSDSQFPHFFVESCCKNINSHDSKQVRAESKIASARGTPERVHPPFSYENGL